MELQVTVTLSDRLFSLLEDKLPNLGRRVEKAITKEIGAQTRAEASIEMAVRATEGSAETQIEIKPKSEEVAKVEQAEATPTEAAPVQEPTDAKKLAEKIREIMHVTRQRFEGQDYKDNADSEAYKKHHKVLTGLFKQIAISLGYEKPSLIDAADKVAAFKAECEALEINKDGFIGLDRKSVV